MYMNAYIFLILFSSTAMSTISLNEDNHVDLLPVVLGLLFVLYIVVILATLAIVVYCRMYHSIELISKDFLKKPKKYCLILVLSLHERIFPQWGM